MTVNEIITLRMNMLSGMNTYIREVICDDNYIEEWNTNGIPDGADEIDFREIAEDEGIWCEICATFGLIIRAHGFYLHLSAE